MYRPYILSNDRKSKYNFFSNMLYVLKCAKEWNLSLFCLIFLAFIPGNIAALFSTLLPSQLVEHLERRSSPAVLIGSTAAVAFVMFLCNMLVQCIYSDFDSMSYAFSGFFAEKYSKKILSMDYEALDSEGVRKLSGNAWRLSRYGSGVSVVLEIFPYFINNVTITFVYGLILARRSVLLTVIILCSVVLDMQLLSLARRKHQKLLPAISKDSRKAEYITSSVTTSMAGKDIRIYRMLDWIITKYDGLLASMDKSYRAIHNWYLLRSGTAAVFNIVKNGLAYFLLLTMLTKGTMTAAEFVFYIGAISNFALYLEMTIRNVHLFNGISAQIGSMREFMEADENLFFTGELSKDAAKEILSGPAVLEFRDVTFSYTEQEEILSHVSFTVQKGEKLALLGLNGAGKTTLVKLICGFYKPDSGDITINGTSIYRFNREQYLECISVLFQDASFLPLSLDRNITGCKRQDCDEKKLDSALALSGFLEKYERLPKRGETELGKELNEGSVDFSGGEKQKLMFARALYKDASLVILDEPTAALDPIAENELYLHYGEAMRGKTGIFISHRLSSTRFCDRIFLLEGGRIVEEGTHKSLLALGGRYAKLYEMQSHYYKEGGINL